MAAGLQTHIWNNNLKSMLLLAGYPFILMAVIWAASAVVGGAMYGGQVDTFENANQFAWAMIYDYWPMIVTIVIIWFTIAYFFQGKMIRALSHAHPVTREQEPALYNLLENLSIAAGVPMPRLEIIETHARNAFASGIDKNSYTVTVTRGLMQSLQQDELEGVLAHELVHILNRDVRLMMVCVIFTGMLGFMAQMLWSYARYALWVPRSSNNKQGGAVMVLFAVVAILWVGYFATMLTRLAISRSREYMADAGAVALTKNPSAMMRALMRISGMADIPKAPGDIAMMCFENTRPFMGLFATHPPIKSRIDALAQTTHTPIPDIQSYGRADAAFQSPQAGRDNWTTRERFKSRRNPWGSQDGRG
jgi:heat shock protein HtpX